MQVSIRTPSTGSNLFTYLSRLLGGAGLSLWEWGSGDFLSGSLWWLKNANISEVQGRSLRRKKTKSLSLNSKRQCATFRRVALLKPLHQMYSDK